jgi:hypothetical protein
MIIHLHCNNCPKCKKIDNSWTGGTMCYVDPQQINWIFEEWERFNPQLTLADVWREFNERVNDNFILYSSPPEHTYISYPPIRH